MSHLLWIPPDPLSSHQWVIIKHVSIVVHHASFTTIHLSIFSLNVSRAVATFTLAIKPFSHFIIHEIFTFHNWMSFTATAVVSTPCISAIRLWVTVLNHVIWMKLVINALAFYKLVLSCDLVWHDFSEPVVEIIECFGLLWCVSAPCGSDHGTVVPHIFRVCVWVDFTSVLLNNVNSSSNVA